MHRDGAGGRRGGGGDPKVKSLSIPFTRVREKKRHCIPFTRRLKGFMYSTYSTLKNIYSRSGSLPTFKSKQFHHSHKSAKFGYNLANSEGEASAKISFAEIIFIYVQNDIII